MATARLIKKRIRATASIKQITKAMQAVAAVKMRRSEEAALRARPYAYAALEILKNIISRGGNFEGVPLMSKGETGKTCVVVISSDKGLAGSFNANVFRKADEFLNEIKSRADVVAIGKKCGEYYKRQGKNVVKYFHDMGDTMWVDETEQVSRFLRENFVNNIYDEVVIIYTNFISALKQEVITRKLLPFEREELEKIIRGIIPLRGKYSSYAGERKSLLLNEYLYEPDQKSVLSELLPALLDIEVYQAILEANASEHSSRMMAMKNASENASDLITNLTIQYNKSRQSQITKELTEITAGKEALSFAQ